MALNVIAMVACLGTVVYFAVTDDFTWMIVTFIFTALLNLLVWVQRREEEDRRYRRTRRKQHMKTLIVAAFIAGALAAPAYGQTVNYPELGGVDQQTHFYNDGEFYTHPSGTVYIHRNGNWEIFSLPGQAHAVPEAPAFLMLGAGLLLLALLWRRRLWRRHEGSGH